MVNFLIQHSKKDYEFTDDKIYSLMNHYNYKHFNYKHNNLRIDFLQHRQDSEKRFLSDEKVVIFYLGNILFKKEEYNTVKQLKKLYLHDKSIVDEIESGRFILIIYDKKKDKFTIINDRFGLIPYYICNDGQNIIFSTEPKGILRSNLLKDKKYRYILGNKYFVKEIRKQKPASIFTFQNDKSKRSQYWQYDPSFDTRINDELLDELLDTFRTGLEKNKKKYPGKYICDISGGYDCRFIYLNNPDVKHALTLGEPDCDEYKIVADTLRLKPANLINVQTKLSKKKIIKLFKLSDLKCGGCNKLDVNDVLQDKEVCYQYKYDGFLGDGILGGDYLNKTKEIKRKLGLKVKYNMNDLNMKDFNENLLNQKFRKKLNKQDKLYEYLMNNFSKFNDDFSLRKNRIIFKLFNRGINRINMNSIINYKYISHFCIILFLMYIQ